MKKSVLLRALQQEIRRHDFNYFVQEPAYNRPGWKRCSRTWMSDVFEENQHDAPVFRPSGR